MRYVSTRSNKDTCKRITASEAIIKGLADDGGLYVPEEIPAYDADWDRLVDLSYKELAFEILSPFLDFSSDELRACIEGAYGNGFDDDRIAPLVKAGGYYFLELFHGKTIAFKDMALSLLPHLMKTAAKRTGIDKEIVILTATSGDTGKAALSGFAGVDGTSVIVFYPKGGVSDIQRLQMVTQEGDNTCVVAVNGNFDDTQRGVKEIFSDRQLAKMLEEKGYLLSSANSINIGRLIPQIVYYYYAYAQLLKTDEIAKNEKIGFVVPTGNFGNILAGYYAKKMGLPIDMLFCASNANNVLFDFFTRHVYDINREFVLTASPSMDILVSSNLERLLYDLSGQDGDKIRALMGELSSNGKYSFDCGDSIRAGYADDNETFAAIKEMYERGYVMDTHTAVAFAAYKKDSTLQGKAVIVSTASPYKFAADVCIAIDGVKRAGTEALDELCRLSEIRLPDAVAGLDTRSVRHTTVIDKNDMSEFVRRKL